MSGRYFSEPTAKLRNYASSKRVDRVWRRLRSELPASSPKRVSSAWWAPAALAAAFALGVYTGVRYQDDPSQPEVGPERVLAAEPGFLPPPPVPVPSVTEKRPKKPDHVRQSRHVARRPVAQAPETDAVAVEPAVADMADAVPVVVEPPEWQKLANLGEYAPALQALEMAGGFDAVLQTASAEQLMILVDIARATGKRGRAIQALRQVTEQYPADPNAPIAAMTLGNLLMQAGDRAGAAAAFALNRVLSPGGDFAEDALAREFEAAIEQGDLEEAKHLAEQYEQDFPNGRRLDDIQRQMSEAVQAETDEIEPSEEDPEVEEPSGADAGADEPQL